LLSFFCIIILLFRFEEIKRTFKIGKSGWNDVEIDRGCFYRGVTEKLADGIEVVSVV
jgi:hypothetical protein